MAEATNSGVISPGYFFVNAPLNEWAGAPTATQDPGRDPSSTPSDSEDTTLGVSATNALKIACFVTAFWYVRLSVAFQ